MDGTVKVGVARIVSGLVIGGLVVVRRYSTAVVRGRHIWFARDADLKEGRLVSNAGTAQARSGGVRDPKMIR